MIAALDVEIVVGNQVDGAVEGLDEGFEVGSGCAEPEVVGVLGGMPEGGKTGCAVAGELFSASAAGGEGVDAL